MDDITIRTHIKPGDTGYIIYLHGILYAREYGFDHTFEAYVAAPMAEFIKAFDEKTDRLWVAESHGQIVGSIAINGKPDNIAQLRWFLLHPDARGHGLGRRLLNAALDFCRERNFDSVYLGTVRELEAAIHLYHSAGFRLTDSERRIQWGVMLTEERYELDF